MPKIYGMHNNDTKDDIFSILRERGFVILRAMGLHPAQRGPIWLGGASLCGSLHTHFFVTRTRLVCVWIAFPLAKS